MFIQEVQLGFEPTLFRLVCEPRNTRPPGLDKPGGLPSSGTAQ